MAEFAEWQRIEKSDNTSFDAYVAGDASPDGHAIVLLQEIFGVNGWVRETAEWMAGQGYLVAAPDLFWRIQPRVDLGNDKESVKTAFSFLERFDNRDGVEDIAVTVRHIKATSPEIKFIHLVGFCLGGRLAVMGASDPNVASAISMYGTGLEKHLNALDEARCPLQLHYGDKDRFIPNSAVAAVEQAAAGKDIEIFIYPGANHGFFSNVRLSYDPAAADLAWSRSRALMRRVAST